MGYQKKITDRDTQLKQFKSGGCQDQHGFPRGSQHLRLKFGLSEGSDYTGVPHCTSASLKNLFSTYK